MSSKSRIVARPHSRRSPLVGAALSLALPLSAVAADPQALSAEPAPRHGQKLDAVHIKDKAATPQVQRSASAKKADPLIDTPQTVTVLKKETLAEQGVGSVTEALR
ncbi:MAG: TonB-dependent siderophore receptor, partial [Burkholderiaceae bacterium]